MIENHTFATPKAQAKIARIPAALTEQPMTRDELQCLLGIAKPTIRRYIEHLRAKPRQIHIARWRRTTGQLAAVYAAGERRDARQPRVLTSRERNQEQWRRIKADPDRHDRIKATARVQGAIHRMRGKPQPWFAALVTSTPTTTRTAP